MPSNSVPAGVTQAGLAGMLEALDLAEDLQVDAWDFALELSVLTASGLSRTHLRWLICKGYALHGIERHPRGKHRRSVRRVKLLSFHEHSCFVLNERGAEFSREIVHDPTDLEHSRSSTASAVAPQEAGLPRWDPKLRQLTVGNDLIIHFLGRRGNQELVVASFHEEGWPDHIDDPLPGVVGADRKQRLRGAIEKLNRRLLMPRIHFCCDGTGAGVCWSIPCAT